MLARLPCRCCTITADKLDWKREALRSLSANFRHIRYFQFGAESAPSKRRHATVIAAAPADTAHAAARPNRPPPVLVQKGTDVSDPLLWQNAAILIDKPQDWTSFDVCGKLRGALRTKKVGHAGTLDPLATGLLIICTGKGTKFVDSYQAMQKEYSGVLRLGQATASYDSMTPIEQELPWQHVSDEELQAAAGQFLGDLLQKPPMYSAVRVKGERLYRAARRGEDVERASRPVHVSAFDLKRESSGSRNVGYRIVCSKGTYVRSLIHDLGQAVGSAAHVTELRREAIGDFSAAQAWPLVDFIAAASSQQLAAAQHLA